jgi:hypothetical protein
MASLSEHFLTPQEYLALERRRETKSEYVDGIWSMPSLALPSVTIMLSRT